MKKLLVLCFVLIANVGAAAPLGADAPERKQLIAMGYELQKEDAGDDFTIASAGSGRIVFSQNEDRLAVTRYFTRTRKLNSAQEFELLKLINTFNDAYTYQISTSEGILQANIYIYGSYDPKTFAKVVRLMERVSEVFARSPEIYKLINE
jgi:hypothetical protein